MNIKKFELIKKILKRANKDLSSQEALEIILRLN